MNELMELAREGVDEIKKAEKIRVISHYDADGISAAAIALTFLLRGEKKVHLSIAKQIKTQLIDELNKEDNDLVLFVELGSGYLDEIDELKSDKIVIADHHHVKGECERAIHINPLLIGKDEDEISGAGVTYLLARVYDEKNKDLAYLAVLGAIGDIQEENWVMKGLNKKILEEAIKTGHIKKEKGIRLFGRTSRPVYKALEYSTDPYIPGISGNESGSIQFLSELGIELKEGDKWRTLNDLKREELQKLASAIIVERIKNEFSKPEEIFGDIYNLHHFKDDLQDAREFATSLNACGRMEQGFIGVLSCMGFSQAQERLGGIVNGYRRMIGKYISWVREGNYEEGEKAWYIVARDQIHENFIGTITSICLKSSILLGKPIIGFAYTQEGGVKVSGRAPEEWIKTGLNLKEVFDYITRNIGGESGGHAGAAGATIPKDKIEEFKEKYETYLEENIKVEYK